jgi:hypothetical protein
MLTPAPRPEPRANVETERVAAGLNICQQALDLFLDRHSPPPAHDYTVGLVWKWLTLGSLLSCVSPSDPAAGLARAKALLRNGGRPTAANLAADDLPHLAGMLAHDSAAKPTDSFAPTTRRPPSPQRPDSRLQNIPAAARLVLSDSPKVGTGKGRRDPGRSPRRPPQSRVAAPGPCAGDDVTPKTATGSAAVEPQRPRELSTWHAHQGRPLMARHALSQRSPALGRCRLGLASSALRPEAFLLHLGHLTTREQRAYRCCSAPQGRRIDVPPDYRERGRDRVRAR